MMQEVLNLAMCLLALVIIHLASVADCPPFLPTGS